MAKIYKLLRTSTLALRHRKAALLRSLAVPADLLRASYVERFNTCGKSNCACSQGRRHGPFYYLTANLAGGKILKFLLKEPVGRAAAQTGVEHYKAHWERLEELSQINVELLRRGEPLSTDPSAT